MAVTTDTANDVIKGALQHILVQEDEATLEPSEFEDARRMLNKMMASFVGNGLTLVPAWTATTTGATVLTVDDACIEGIESLLALRLAPMFSRPVPPELRLMARDGYNTMLRFGHLVIETRFPGTLPVGSGNYDNTFNDDHFYPDNNDAILAGTVV
jgi:hypothetical protein